MDHAYSAHQAPMLPSQYLVVTDRHVRQSIQVPIEGRRKFPQILPVSASTPIKALQLVLENPLQVGEQKWSQVWKGTISSRAAPEIEPAPVAIKIFQQSFFKYLPCMRDFMGDPDRVAWFSGANLAGNEAWAFDRMQRLQGTFYFLTKCMSGALSRGRSDDSMVLRHFQGGSTDYFDSLLRSS